MLGTKRPAETGQSFIVEEKRDAYLNWLQRLGIFECGVG